MNMIILVLLVILGYTYFGGPKVPKILKDYKEMLLGVFVGILLHQFFGIRMEGLIEGGPGGLEGLQAPIPLSNFCPSSDPSEYKCHSGQSGPFNGSGPFRQGLSRMTDDDDGVYHPHRGGDNYHYECPPGSQMVKFQHNEPGRENVFGNICIPTGNPDVSLEDLKDIHIKGLGYDSLTRESRIAPAGVKVVVCPHGDGTLELHEDGEGNKHLICPTE